MSRYTRIASTDSQEEAIEQVESWLNKMNKHIVGGITMGKSPQAVLLDLTYQGGEIYINSRGEIMVNDIEVDRFELFKDLVLGESFSEDKPIKVKSYERGN